MLARHLLFLATRRPRGTLRGVQSRESSPTAVRSQKSLSRSKSQQFCKTRTNTLHSKKRSKSLEKIHQASFDQNPQSSKKYDFNRTPHQRNLYLSDPCLSHFDGKDIVSENLKYRILPNRTSNQKNFSQQFKYPIALRMGFSRGPLSSMQASRKDSFDKQNFRETDNIKSQQSMRPLDVKNSFALSSGFSSSLGFLSLASLITDNQKSGLKRDCSLVNHVKFANNISLPAENNSILFTKITKETSEENFSETCKTECAEDPKATNIDSRTNSHYPNRQKLCQAAFQRESLMKSLTQRLTWKFQTMRTDVLSSTITEDSAAEEKASMAFSCE